MRLPFNRWESDDERIHPLLCEERGTNGGGHLARCSLPVRLTLRAQSDIGQLRELLGMTKTLFE